MAAPSRRRTRPTKPIRYRTPAATPMPASAARIRYEELSRSRTAREAAPPGTNGPLVGMAVRSPGDNRGRERRFIGTPGRGAAPPRPGGQGNDNGRYPGMRILCQLPDDDARL